MATETIEETMKFFKVDSDKIFLRASDMETIQVEELEGLYLSPVKAKYWTHLATIKVGGNGGYQGLQIVGPADGSHNDPVEISSANLESLAKDLYGSHLIVNREGLCYLATPEDTSSMFGVEYYRLFDLFHWPKYGVNVPFLNTNWARRHIVDGRLLVVYAAGDVPTMVAVEDPEKDKQAEIEKLKRIKAEQKLLEDRRRKLEEELKEKQAEIDKLKQKHDKERRLREIELKAKLDEIDEWKRNHKDQALLKKVEEDDVMFRYVLVKYPPHKFKVPTNGVYDVAGRPKPVVKSYYTAAAHFTPEIESKIPDISIMAGVDYDRNDWLVCAVTDREICTGRFWTPEQLIIIYYDGQRVAAKDANSAPQPADDYNMQLFPKGFHTFCIDTDNGRTDNMLDYCYRWGILYSVANGEFCLDGLPLS